MTKKLYGFLCDVKGVAAIEAAFIFPFLLLLFIGLIDITGMVTTTRKVTYASSVLADLVTQHKTAIVKAEVDEYYNAVNMVMKPRDASDIKIEVFAFRKTGTNVNQIWQRSNTGGPSCGATISTSGMLSLMTADNDVVVARVCTTFTPWIATFLGHSILGAASFVVKETTSQRPRSSKMLNCVTVAGGTTACS
jgi:Flp pilus assembly protein TadG